MNLCNLLVKVSSHPGVVDADLWRCLQLDVAIDAAPAVDIAHQPLARRQHVVHAHENAVRTARLHKRRDVVLVGAAVGIHPRDRMLVHPEPALGAHAADLEPDLLAAPIRWQGDIFAVPALAHVDMTELLGAAVPERIPWERHSRLAHALRLPGAGHVDLPRLGPRPVHAAAAGDRRIFVHLCKRHLRVPVPARKNLGLREELPFAAQGDEVGRRLASDRVHHGRQGLDPRPRVYAMQLLAMPCKRNQQTSAK